MDRDREMEEFCARCRMDRAHSLIASYPESIDYNRSRSRRCITYSGALAIASVTRNRRSFGMRTNELVACVRRGK